MRSFEKVYKMVRMIPKGKVSTYGAIGKKLHLNPRVVGYALHLNPDSNLTPCHRVVNRNGRVAPGFAFGGPGIQKKKLEAEGIKFLDENYLNLKDYLFSF